MPTAAPACLFAWGTMRCSSNASRAAIPATSSMRYCASKKTRCTTQTRPLRLRRECRRTCGDASRSEEHTSELQSLMRISYAVFCLKKKKNRYNQNDTKQHDKNTKNM